MKTAEEYRAHRLKMLQEAAGGQKALAEALQRSPSQIGQYSGGFRVMGPDFARHVEQRFGKPRGWMDQPVSVDANHVHLHAVCEPGARYEDRLDLDPSLTEALGLLAGLSSADRKAALINLRIFAKTRDFESIEQSKNQKA